MKMQGIMQGIQDAAQFAAALEIMQGISVQPGQAADIATVAHAARRLSEKLASVQKAIAREVAQMKGVCVQTAGREDEDVVQMLIRSQEVQ